MTGGFPGRRSNIDHLFVGASGVFVIDAKRYRNAEVSVERHGGLFGPTTENLKVGGRRRNNLVDGVRGQCEVVRAALTAAGHEVWRSSRCSASSTPTSLPQEEPPHRGRAGSPVRRWLGEVAATEGSLDDAARFELAMALSSALPSMS